MTTFKVFRNSCRATVTQHGEISARIEAHPTPAFAGDATETVAYLEALGVGVSVEVRQYEGGHWQSSRSCMNKPALWRDILVA